ncbi:peptidase M50B-like-domain-containing protein [Cantharellus anzutake]|uniref:peptidase M50B-like-domain-containing protein n=1 Tax=Cantharellus anzutake TaxID=1750568 RepID=UPI0019058AF9|nr:peptidase M50B-like-domain-containing protein [Cantharellus anzutake]KAF8329439.1 peptidase M50B-like-domain-containing protein [Cantharellus anzutake]
MVVITSLLPLPRIFLALLSAISMAPTPAAVTRPPLAPPRPTSTHYVNPLTPTTLQIPVLYVSVIYLVIDVALWHLPGARVIINPFKLLTIGFLIHCHSDLPSVRHPCRIFDSVTIDPNLGGCTRVQGGHPPSILAAGYIGSTLFGAALMTGGWDILAAKITSFIIAIALVVPLIMVRDKLTIILTIIYEGLLIGFWFIDHGSALRWYSLFVGVIFYALWDYLDDRYFKKANDSDSTQFSEMYPRTKPTFWGFFWITWSVLIYIGFTLVGLASFKGSREDMYANGAKFLPT